MTAAGRPGTTTVAERAVRKVAERAATEALPDGAHGRPAKGAASVRGTRAQVSLGVTLPYPAPLAGTVRSVQQHVTGRTRQLTGLDVPTVGIEVTSLAPPRATGGAVPPADPADPADEQAPDSRTPRRCWSRRRVPAALLAAAAATACGALAFDLVRVHLAHRPAAAWRVSTVHWLSGHGPGDASVVVAGAATALLGLGMVLLAVTPGLRRRSTVRVPAPRVEATVDRSAVRALVRDAVSEVAGIGAVRVRVRRRRFTVRAGLAFGDRAGARADVTAAAGDALASCRLRRPPRLRVVVTPEAAWQPPPSAMPTADRGPGLPEEGEA
ncbi:DUF6286 domain-containing protein [Streptomyces lincolnensis]|uniref:DUF6286 domain-containing Asp23/Gls24 family envelope stress response protein n=1 Tax=Streptomyces lincolnensis TaxID=1915 RepID=UPI001E328C51|nr:DUF6286 domain-containing protein [Streptomyces lincolnensis]MCD7440783.1 DUF6286 domain-containing protein [Streptomyces lincolnensis]